MRSTEFFTLSASAKDRSRTGSEGIVRYLTIVGLTFLALVLALEPDVGFTAPLTMRVVFWTLQIATGLFVLQWVLNLITRRFGASCAPCWSLVLLSGLLGAVVLTPIYWLIGEGLMEGWLGYAAGADEESANGLGITVLHALIQEYLDIVGPVTTAWALICLPRLHWLMPPLLHGQTLHSETDRSPETSLAAPELSDRLDKSNTTSSPTPTRATWRERLPAEIGSDVIAVSSELQYLRVWTTRGCALILGALADVESETAENGLRVHRSWWVAAGHVVRVRRTATSAVCLMSDGREVPVSRRRRSQVIARFGDAAQYRVGVESKAVANTDLN